MRGMLKEVGYASALLVRETELGYELLDGHLRKALTPDQEVPVLVLDLDEAEANKLLALFDPLTSLAEADANALKELTAHVNSENETLQKMLEAAHVTGDFDLDWEGIVSDTAIDGGGDGQGKDVTCPSCGHEFKLS